MSQTSSTTHTANSGPVARVLYLLRYYPRFSETFIVNEILELERQGADVHILAMRRPDDGFFHESVCRVRAVAGYLPEDERKLRRRVMPHAKRYLRAADLGSRRLIRSLRRAGRITTEDVLGAIFLARHLNKVGIDHVHVHFGKEASSLAYLAHLLTGVRFTMTLHAYDIFRDDVDTDLLSRKINAAERVVTVSRYNLSFLYKHFQINDDRKVMVLYNGIDTERFTIRNHERDERVIMSVGRLIEKKGFLYLIEAVGLLRDRGIEVTCRIVGEGKQGQELRQRVCELGLTGRVELTGLLRQDAVSDLMAKATCFVLPCVHASDGNVDALPTVLLESMACGTPCVSTRVSGVPEIIDTDENGILVEPAEVLALADAIQLLVLDPVRAQEMGRAARAKACQFFDVRKNVQVLHLLFQEIAAVGGRQRISVAGSDEPAVSEEVVSS